MIECVSTLQDLGSNKAPFKSLSQNNYGHTVTLAAGSCSASSLKLGPDHGEQLHGFGPLPSEREKAELKLFAIAVCLTPFAVGGLLACIVI